MTAFPSPAGLRAFTVPLPPGPPIDPVAVGADDGVLFARPELTVAGRGTAALLPLPDGLTDDNPLAAVAEWLSAVPHHDAVERPGSRVMALGSLAFSPGAPGTLTVPSLLYGRHASGAEWAVVVASAEQPPDPVALRAELSSATTSKPSDGRGVPRLSALPSPAAYAAAVGQAVTRIGAGELAKVVLARCVDATGALPSPAGVLRRLWATDPSCTAFSFPVAPDGTRFLGVTPELLVSRRATAVRCHPLAGTVGLDGSSPASDDEAIEGFLASAKNRMEHELMVHDIEAALRPWCKELEVPQAPSLVRLHSVAHFGTLITGTLAGDPPARVLALLAALHPTPAVGGVPTAAALQFIDGHEPFDRDRWAGPVGWCDATGDGDWMIGIRSVTLAGDRARLCAGAGIVWGSDPAAELAETTVKLTPVLQALWPGSAALLD